MKQRVTGLGNGARGAAQGGKLIIYNRGMGGRGGPTRSEKLIIYNKGTERGGGINRLKNPNGKCEGRGGVDGVKN